MQPRLGNILAVAGLCLLVGAVSPTAYASCVSGQLNGYETVNYWGFYASEGDVIDFSISASGSGSNKLTVKVQQRKSSGGWVNIYESFVEPGDTLNGRVTVRDYFGSTTEQLQFKLSRDLGTKMIFYDLCL